jgi:hypothetical protein
MPRGIDHLVLAARDLNAQADLYRRLGFQVGARNRHPWGTLNHIVQFDRHFLELISTEPGFVRPDPRLPVAQFSDPIADLLGRREGMSQLVLESADAAADQADFAAHGIGGRETFFFERRGRRPDGSEVHVAFTLAFARHPEIREAGFFVCQQHFPENFWNPAFQRHPNRVTGVAAVVMHAVGEAADAVISRFCRQPQSSPIAGGRAYDTGRGLIELVERAAFERAYGEAPVLTCETCFAAVRFACRDLAALERGLLAGRVPHGRQGDRIVVPAAAAHGIALAFETRGDRPSARLRRSAPRS